MATLTDAQKVILKANILLDPVLAALPHTVDAASQIADAYALPASPAFTVWVPDASVQKIMENGFIWTLVDGITPGKRDEWIWLTKSGVLDFTKANVRAGIDDCWKGTIADMVAQRAAIYAHGKTPANRGEKLFAVGTGSDASPATRVLYGTIWYFDIFLARDLP